MRWSSNERRSRSQSFGEACTTSGKGKAHTRSRKRKPRLAGGALCDRWRPSLCCSWLGYGRRAVTDLTPHVRSESRERSRRVTRARSQYQLAPRRYVAHEYRSDMAYQRSGALGQSVDYGRVFLVSLLTMTGDQCAARTVRGLDRLSSAPSSIKRKGSCQPSPAIALAVPCDPELVSDQAPRALKFESQRGRALAVSE